MEKRKKIKRIFLLIISGIAIGLLNGFFGGGGGMVCVPILEKILNLDAKQSHATAIAVILPLCIVSSFVYIFKVGIDSVNLAIVTIGVIIGGIAGACLLKKLNNKWIRVIFAFLMLAGGIKMII